MLALAQLFDVVLNILQKIIYKLCCKLVLLLVFRQKLCFKKIYITSRVSTKTVLTKEKVGKTTLTQK